MSARHFITVDPRTITPGQKFGRLTVVSNCEPTTIPSGRVRPYYLCRCECGKEKRVDGNCLSAGTIRSCGCLARDRAKEKAKHGGARTRLYRIFMGMIARCEKEAREKFKDYGARGIRICDEWRRDFATFKAWALGNGYRPDLTIERIDNDGVYGPSNCRWATPAEQMCNTRRTHFLSAFGEVKPLTLWARDPRCKVSVNALFGRLKAGWPVEDAITMPDQRGRWKRQRHE